MAEEKTVGSSVSDAEIAAIEKDVKAQETAQMEAVKKETAEQVRKELAAEQALKEAQAAKAELERKLEAQQSELDKVRKENDTALKAEVERRIAEAAATRKGVVAGGNPFDAPVRRNPAETMSDADLKSVEVASWEALRARGDPRNK